MSTYPVHISDYCHNVLLKPIKAVFLTVLAEPTLSGQASLYEIEHGDWSFVLACGYAKV
jgi:hypothetical protein